MNMKNIISIAILSIAIFNSCNKTKSIDESTEISSIENGLVAAIQIKGEIPEQYNILERMNYHMVPGVSIVVVKGGEIKWAKGYGVANAMDGRKVDTNTIFQAGSISKPLAALASLKLVEEGKVDLDQDVNKYLINWKIPENKFTNNDKVTLRKLLTHTAGITVPSFPGYNQKDTLPTIEEVLNGKGNTPAVYVDTIPGSIWRYSGGAYMVMEKFVEDISGLCGVRPIRFI